MKKVLSLLLVVVMIFGLAACGGGEESKEPEKVEKITVALSSWPTSLDPAALMGKQNTPWLAQVYDTLLYNSEPGVLDSYICESWEMIDELTAEFKLKEGITFHNGDPLTAEDIKYSYERVLNDDTGYINANIPGVVSTITNIEVVDELTVRMSTDAPDPILLDRVGARLGVWIVPQNYLEEVGTDVFGTQPMGTGPYKVDSISPESMMLSYYEGYYGDAPLAATVEYRYIAEETAMITAMVNGDIDIADTLSTTAADLLKGYDNVQVFNEQASTSHLLRFNTKTGPTSDKLLRQAMSLAIDRQLLVDSLWDAPARFNELGHQLETETDDAVRKEVYREMTQIWDDEVIGTILYCPNTMWAVREGLDWGYKLGIGKSLRAEYLTLK